MANIPNADGSAGIYSAQLEISGAQVTIAAASLGLLSDLISRLQRTETKPVPQPDAAKPAKETTAGKSESSSAGAAEKPSAAKQTATAVEKPAETAQASGKDEVLDYAVLQKAMFTLAGIEKQAALDLNAKFGVKTMKDLPEGKRREALAAVEAKIAELKAAAEAVA